MKIGLLGCDEAPSHLRHLGGTYHDMFERLLAPAFPDATFEWFDAIQGQLPAAPDACDAYVCTGSRHSAYAQDEWIERLKAFVRTLHDERRPFVGICFGHQILAEALGGKVEPARQGWGVGVLDMEVVQPEAWIEPPLAHCKLQYMHADQVQVLPPGSTILARAEHCPVAMFRVGDTSLGIEGHPEFPASYVEALVRARTERIGEERAQRALAHVNDATQHEVVAQWIRRFVDRARQRQARDVARAA